MCLTSFRMTEVCSCPPRPSSRVRMDSLEWGWDEVSRSCDSFDVFANTPVRILQNAASLFATRAPGRRNFASADAHFPAETLNPLFQKSSTFDSNLRVSVRLGAHVSVPVCSVPDIVSACGMDAWGPLHNQPPAQTRVLVAATRGQL